MACAGSGRCLHPRFFSKRFRFCPAARINASQLTHSSSRKRSRRMPCQSLQISRRAVRPTHCAYGGLSCRARSVDSHVPDPDTPHPHSGTDCVPAYWWYTGPSAGTHYSPRHRPDSVVVGPSIAPAQSAVLCPPAAQRTRKNGRAADVLPFNGRNVLLRAVLAITRHVTGPQFRVVCVPATADPASVGYPSPPTGSRAPSG